MRIVVVRLACVAHHDVRHCLRTDCPFAQAKLRWSLVSQTATYVGCTTTLRADPQCEASPLTSIEELAELHTPDVGRDRLPCNFVVASTLCAACRFQFESLWHAVVGSPVFPTPGKPNWPTKSLCRRTMFVCAADFV